MSTPVTSSASASPRDSAARTAVLYSTVVLCGAAVMVLELLGTRIVGPFYGASLYVWSALITVTLVALALGYYLGGYLASRSGLRLSDAILAAAVATALIPFASGPVLMLTDALGIRVGALVSAFLLFTVPLTCLAMVGPLVIQLATRELSGVGLAVGSVYAVSTVGSVIGTLALTFVLLPLLGTPAILYAASLLLGLLGCGVAFVLEELKGRRGATSLAIAGLAGLLALAGTVKPAPAAEGFKVLHAEESGYGWVRVVEDLRNNHRLLLSDASVLSAMELEKGRSLLNYQAIMRWLPVFRPNAQQTLLIGLGGGHVARDLHAAGMTVDTIEIDPAVARAAREYFGFRPTGEFLVGDARYEIRKLRDKRYDFILHDCFTGGSEPTHMLTQEMLAELRAMLVENGILTLNYVGFREGEGSEAVASVHKTLTSLFPNVRVFVTEKENFTDFLFLASPGSLVLDDSRADGRVQWLLEHEYLGGMNGRGIVITDAFNPMESLQIRKAETYRRLFMGRVAPELLLR